MRNRLVLALSFSSAAALTALALAGCSGSSPTTPTAPPNEPPMASSSLARDTAPNVPATDAEALRSGDTAFAADLYQTLASAPTAKGQNLFFSPHSISLALAMTYAGAKGNTATQMASALHFTLPQDKLHPALDALDLALASRATGSAYNGTFKLNVTNSMWGAPQTSFAQPFLDTLATDYGSGVRLTDFAADPEAARTKINTWVDQETNDRIKQLLPDGTITVDTRFVLVNAIYFNAQWASPFDPSQTQPATFHGVNGDTNAPMMHQSLETNYAAGNGWKAVSLGYDAQELEYVAVLPDDLGSFETGLSATEAEAISSSMGSTLVDLTLPKYSIQGATFSLRSALTARGMVDAFDPSAADFSGIASNDKLYLSDVLHQAFVSVDEKGTEAAAATASIGAGSAAPSNRVTLTFDKPFLFFVRDVPTGAILFMGRVVTV